MTFVAFYSVNVEINAESLDEAKRVAERTRRDIGFDQPILVPVRDDTLIVNLERVVEWKR